MNYQEFLTTVIDEGVSAAKKDYAGSSPRRKQKRDGSVAGFEACRDKDPAELKLLLESSRIATEDAHRNEHDKYWWYRCYELEVEWVCNVVSAMLVNQQRAPIIPPTARGMIQAGKILGVKPT